MNSEQWKDIKGYESRYMISDKGRVFSKKRGRILKNTCTGRYAQVSLFDDNRICTTFRPHQLTGKYFVPNPNKKPELNHKDGNRYNNKSDNLEWVTHRENIIHAHDTGLTKRLVRKPVFDTQAGVFYESISEAAIYSKFKKGNISNMLSGIVTNRTNLILV